MKHSARTTMGGARSTFQTTRWSQIKDAKTLDETRQKAVMTSLIRAYWKPVYSYLRRKGCDNEQAKDLTQGFFHEIVLGRGLVQRADKERGRFRTFLLTALDRYVTSVHRRNVAAKRHPKNEAVLIGELDEASLPVAAGDMRPDELFTYMWASVLLQDVLEEVEQDCSTDGKAVHWGLFQARVLDPIMAGAEPRPLAELCREFGVTNEVKAENMIVTVKRRFGKAIRRRVRRHVESEQEVDDEIRDLMKILGR